MTSERNRAVAAKRRHQDALLMLGSVAVMALYGVSAMLVYWLGQAGA